MKALVTGGAGFIGRWVVQELIQRGVDVIVLDDLSNGRLENLLEFQGNPRLAGFVRGDIKDSELCSRLSEGMDVCYHLGASINVQDSIDDPRTTFNNDVCGTFNVLEGCRKHGVKMVFVSSCMVYARSNGAAITEEDATFPASPYAASKLAGEQLVISYSKTYGMPTVVLRPFNTYGPFQKSGGEGGVVAVFAQKALREQTLQIYGDGTQTRDLLYVEDCARFIVEAGFCKEANGEVINAATGSDISINELAAAINGSTERIVHVAHIHPQSEIARLVGSWEKAKRILGWAPRVSLKEGVERTRRWIAQTEGIELSCKT